MKSAAKNRLNKYLLSKCILLIFKIMGLAPFSIRKPTKVNKSSKDTWQVHNCPRFINSRTGGLYNCVLILVQLSLSFLSMPMASEITYPGKSKITLTIELCLTIWGNIAVIVIWLMYCIKQKNLVILANRLTHIDATLDRVNGTNIADKSGLRNYIILLATNTFLWIQLLLCEELAYNAPIITWFGFIVPSIITNWFTVQYVLALKLIENRLKYLNHVLLDCSINSIVFPLRTFLIGRVSIDDLQVPKIVSLRRAHTCLYEISCGVADFYSLPILMTVGFVGFLSLYSAYYLMLPFVLEMEKQTNWMVANSICWLVLLMMSIAILAAAVNGVTAEMKKTADIIPDLLARRTTSRQDKIELEMFSFELLHKDIEFTAYKFFPLDGTLVQSVFGTVATYLTIIFQLQVGTSNRTSDIDQNITNANAEVS